MISDERYDRALAVALKLATLVSERPDLPQYVLVGQFVYAILPALEEEAKAVRLRAGAASPN